MDGLSALAEPLESRADKPPKAPILLYYHLANGLLASPTLDLGGQHAVRAKQRQTDVKVTSCIATIGPTSQCVCGTANPQPPPSQNMLDSRYKLRNPF